ncbi:3-ketoacyl-ACP reductase [Anaerocolumna sp. MB42-C2]|uniref:3-ketoacyl-ACP reductase n=1 Tax=Anaerocolumna sp. MB42-C2 TaxID=3070997 RepID=UPI0027E1E2D2|nr:3-ketoacyl-ACP reductase [Anaerocolumna sp. MB42-C2]WMJ86694.1 3-ketoacyl-ACP reductase [Anaerocolumna sp. MB42-C2]
MMEKVAAVTGSRRGIGLAIATALARKGYRIIISGTAMEQETEEVLESLRKLETEVSYIRCDIKSSSERLHFVHTILDRYGRLDVFVNNAGTAPRKRMDLLKTTEENYDFVMDTNLKGTFFMCQAVANEMIELKKKELINYTPRIINIASISSYTSSTNRGEYCISKAGISMVTSLFADRLAEYGIPVFEIRPGIILTDMTAGVKSKYETLIADGITPIKRFGLPQDVADCVLAIESGNLDFATGQVLNADGGFHIRRL